MEIFPVNNIYQAIDLKQSIEEQFNVEVSIQLDKLNRYVVIVNV